MWALGSLDVGLGSLDVGVGSLHVGLGSLDAVLGSFDVVFGIGLGSLHVGVGFVACGRWVRCMWALGSLDVGVGFVGCGFGFVGCGFGFVEYGFGFLARQWAMARDDIEIIEICNNKSSYYYQIPGQSAKIKLSQNQNQVLERLCSNSRVGMICTATFFRTA